MKKLLFILAIIAMTTPMLAQQVNFVVTDIGDGKVQIGYANSGVAGPDLPVGIALKIVCSGCEATGLDSYDTTEFPAYIDFAYSEETIGDGYDPLGEGQPLAKEENVPGRFDTGSDFPATTVYVCMGRVQDAVPGPNPGPDTVVNLVTLQLADTTASGNGFVSVYEDTSSRGGVVGGGNPFATSLPEENVEITFYNGCYPLDMPDWQTWSDVGEPNCWCYPSQCYGDADGLIEGVNKKWAVGALDIGILVSAWKVKEPTWGSGISGTQLCADFDHLIEGVNKKWRVGALDIGILVVNWKVKEPTWGSGTPTDCGGTLVP